MLESKQRAVTILKNIFSHYEWQIYDMKQHGGISPSSFRTWDIPKHSCKSLQTYIKLGSPGIAQWNVHLTIQEHRPGSFHWISSVVIYARGSLVVTLHLHVLERSNPGHILCYRCRTLKQGLVSSCLCLAFWLFREKCNQGLTKVVAFHKGHITVFVVVPWIPSGVLKSVASSVSFIPPPLSQLISPYMLFHVSTPEDSLCSPGLHSFCRISSHLSFLPSREVDTFV